MVRPITSDQVGKLLLYRVASIDGKLYIFGSYAELLRNEAVAHENAW